TGSSVSRHPAKSSVACQTLHTGGCQDQRPVKRHWKKIVIALAAVIVLVVAGSWFYAKVINKAPAKLSNADLVAALDAPIGGSTTTAPAAGRAANYLTGGGGGVSASIGPSRL